MTIKYVGCEDANSATAKIISKNTITYYGSWYEAQCAIYDKHESGEKVDDALYRKKGNRWVEIEYWF